MRWKWIKPSPEVFNNLCSTAQLLQIRKLLQCWQSELKKNLIDTKPPGTSTLFVGFPLVELHAPSGPVHGVIRPPPLAYVHKSREASGATETTKNQLVAS